VLVLLPPVVPCSVQERGQHCSRLVSHVACCTPEAKGRSTALTALLLPAPACSPTPCGCTKSAPCWLQNRRPSCPFSLVSKLH
jgi:hypothetical protein